METFSPWQASDFILVGQRMEYGSSRLVEVVYFHEKWYDNKTM